MIKQPVEAWVSSYRSTLVLERICRLMQPKRTPRTLVEI